MSTALVAGDRPVTPPGTFHPLQPRPPMPSVLGKQQQPPQAPAQPGPKRAKKDKDDIEDENDIFKVQCCLEIEAETDSSCTASSVRLCQKGHLALEMLQFQAKRRDDLRLMCAGLWHQLGRGAERSAWEQDWSRSECTPKIADACG